MKFAATYSKLPWFSQITAISSIRAHLSLLICVFALILGFVSATVLARGEFKAAERARVQSVSQIAQVLSTSMRALITEENFKSLHSLICNIVDEQGGDYIYVDLRDVTDRNYADFINGTPKHVLEKPLLEAAYATGEQQVKIVDGRVHVALPVSDENKIVGAMILGWGVTDQWTILKRILISELYILTPLILLVMAAIGFISRRLIRPIEEITNAANQLAKGERVPNIDAPSAGELGRLSDAFNKMASQLSSSMAQMERDAFEDQLTNLPNRTAFNKTLEAVLLNSQKTGDRTALFFLDMDHFKRINDTLGHDAGDQLLSQMAARLNESITSILRDRAEFTFARFGGDEFTLLLHDLTDETIVEEVAVAINKCLERPLDLEGSRYCARLSIGIALGPDHGQTPSQLLKAADLAMYEAKKQGRGCHVVFIPDHAELLNKRMYLEAELREAIKNEEIAVHYQPKIDLKTGSVTGVEALARWHHAKLGPISPVEFIKIAEETRMILPLGLLVLRRAIADAAIWRRAGNDVPVAVNVSALQLASTAFYHDVVQALEEHRFPPHMLELEVTESVAMLDASATATCINPLLDLGVHFAIDDFGTGYSNLAQLRNTSFDVFKIDRSFIDRVVEDKDAQTIVATILAMTKIMNFTSVAEGIETKEQADFLASAGCDLGQGYHFAKPMDANALHKFLQVGSSQMKAA